MLSYKGNNNIMSSNHKGMY